MTSKTLLIEQLRDLGVEPGSAVMVHASLRKLGPVDGGASGLIAALCDSLAPAGTVLMVLGADDSRPFDVTSTPADPEIGALAEEFRRHPGVAVSDHAAARFAAMGPAASALLDGTPLHDYYGSGSTLERFTAMGGQVLRLGADTNTITLTHWAEYLADVPNKRRVRVRYVRADSGEQFIESLDDSLGIVDWQLGDYFHELWFDFRAAGSVRSGTVGRSLAELFAARDYVPFAVRWLEERFG